MTIEIPRPSGFRGGMALSPEPVLSTDRGSTPLEPLRLVICGDFRLHLPCSPVRGLPEPLRERLREAHFEAAQRVFELALIEQVDTLVLIGPLFSSAEYGVREPAFLLRECERLDRQGIPVVWVREQYQLMTWPDWFPLPGNVVEIDSDVRQSYRLLLPGRPRVALYCLPLDGSWVSSSPDEIQIGIIPLEAEFKPQPRISLLPGQLAGLTGNKLDGLLTNKGLYVPNQFSDEPSARMLPTGIGPQGRGFAETGPHGCRLMVIHHDRRIECEFIPCDVVRWQIETATLDDLISREELLQHCLSRSQRLVEGGHAVILLRWQLTGHGPLARELMHESCRREFLQALREAVDPALADHLWIVEVGLDLDVKEEARLRSEQSPWAAWSSALNELALAHTKITSHQEHLVGTTESTSPSTEHRRRMLSGPHHRRLKHKALQQLMQPLDASNREFPGIR